MISRSDAWSASIFEPSGPPRRETSPLGSPSLRTLKCWRKRLVRSTFVRDVCLVRRTEVEVRIDPYVGMAVHHLAGTSGPYSWVLIEGLQERTGHIRSR